MITRQTSNAVAPAFWDVLYIIATGDCRMSVRVTLLLLLLATMIANDVNGHVELIGAGATAPSGVYIAWMAAYRSSRHPFVDVRLSYRARGSGFGKQAIASGSVTYAGSDSLLSEDEYDSNPELQMFPSIALLVSCFVLVDAPLRYRFL